MHTRKIAKHNLHSSPRNFSKHEVNGEIDKVIKDEKIRRRSLLHINNPQLYSNSASGDTPNVNVVDKINFQKTPCTSEVISNDKCIGLTFYRKQTSNTDEIENARNANNILFSVFVAFTTWNEYNSPISAYTDNDKLRCE